MNKHLQVATYCMCMIACLSFCAAQITTLVREDQIRTANDQKQKAIKAFYDRLTCERSSCTDPAYECREYCYDKLDGAN